LTALSPSPSEPQPTAPGGERRRGGTHAKLVIHEERKLEVDAPPRSRFKAYASYLVQDLMIRPHVTCSRRQRWQTPDGKTVIAPLPAGVDGHFGLELRRFVLAQYHRGQVTAARLATLLQGFGVVISTRGASGSFFWWDELAKARRSELGWSNMMFGMREGNPRGIVTTTPKPVPILKKLLKAKSTFTTTGSTWDNRPNLSEVFYREVIEPLEGTRTGRQEINAEVIDDLPGALASRGKVQRAEPISVLYEKEMVTHVAPDMLELEDQQCQMATDGFMGEGSPDQLEYVWTTRRSQPNACCGHMSTR
jgi:hypothetical protein